MGTRTLLLLLALLLNAATAGAEDKLTGEQILERVMASDPWGMSGAEIRARAIIGDKRGARSQLSFRSKSMQYDPPLSKSVVRFSAPSDLAGAAFLQVQKKGGDDDRFLFLPDLKRSRRISGSLRSNAFMGTDFTYADLDRRDMRNSTAILKGHEKIGKFPCYKVEVVPSSKDSEYARIEAWVREDNFLPLKMAMYDRANVLLKTFMALEVKRVGGRWFISRSRMVNARTDHRTELVLEDINVAQKFSESEFTVRALEKL